MKHVRTSDFSAAVFGCPNPRPPSFAPIFRGEIIRAVRSARRHIGLTRTDLAVLDACLSYLPLKNADGTEQPAQPNMMLTVFASNRSICARVGDLDDRCLRRAISNLVALGLLKRHDSATGKRYARRIDGQIVDAYGLNLLPFFAKGQELITLARELERDEANRRSIRSEAVNLRALIIREEICLTDTEQKFVAESEKLLRRASLTTGDVASLRDRLHALMQAKLIAKVPMAGKESAANGQNVRHIESNKIDLKKEDTPEQIITSDEQLHTVYENCLEVQKYLPEPPRSTHQLKAMILQIMLWIGCSKAICTDLTQKGGWVKVLMVLERALPRLSDIKNVPAYLKAATLPAGKVQP